jgi:hypothetical protein
MKRLATVLIFLLLGIAAVAETAQFDGQRENHMLRGTGQDVVLRGQYNDLIITGEVGTITIYGQYNDVIVDSCKAIVFKGSYNDVDIRNGNPQISDQGSFNDVVGVYDGGATGTVIVDNDGGTGVDVDGAEIVVNGAALRKVYEGNGRSFVINGASNDITINGQAHSVVVNGSSNKVHVDEASNISASGFGNAVTYSKGQPNVSRSGVNVTVQKL